LGPFSSPYVSAWGPSSQASRYLEWSGVGDTTIVGSGVDGGTASFIQPEIGKMAINIRSQTIDISYLSLHLQQTIIDTLRFNAYYFIRIWIAREEGAPIRDSPEWVVMALIA
jgi:hypothetical protein